MFVVTVVGARPQFIKAFAVSKALDRQGAREVLVHSGQHYDVEMSRVFFDELGLRRPDVNLEVGSGSHAWQTAEIMVRLEDYIERSGRPDWMIVYGDTNTTLAAALVAAKAGVPIAHVEAGLRSGDRSMPEETNRVVADHLAARLYAPTDNAMRQLHAEGLGAGAVFCGDVMLDVLNHFKAMIGSGRISAGADLPSVSYTVATIHRPANTDDRRRLRQILDGLGQLGEKVVLPAHPRTKEALADIDVPDNIEVRRPASYLTMLSLLMNASRVVTDSGGLQKEAYWLGVPCITTRDRTEWPETLGDGRNVLVDADTEALIRASRKSPTGEPIPFGAPPAGHETVADCIVADLMQSTVGDASVGA